METIKKLYRINRREISFLKFIIEAYEGIAVVSTINRETGVVAIYIPQGCEEEVAEVIDDLRKGILIEEL